MVSIMLNSDSYSSGGPSSGGPGNKSGSGNAGNKSSSGGLSNTNATVNAGNANSSEDVNSADWRKWVRSPILPRGKQKASVVRNMFDTIAPRYDLVNKLMTFGLDSYWRHRAIKALALPSGSLVLDLATGTGDLVRELRRQSIRVVGLDLSLGMLMASKVEGSLVQADGSNSPFPNHAFDGVISAFAIRNFSDLPAILRELSRIIRPGGRLSLLDISEPSGLLGMAARMWFEQGAPLIGSLLSDKDAYSYLPRSVQYLPSPVEMKRMMGEAGFSCNNHHVMTAGITQLYTGTKSSE